MVDRFKKSSPLSPCFAYHPFLQKKIQIEKNTSITFAAANNVTSYKEQHTSSKYIKRLILKFVY